LVFLLFLALSQTHFEPLGFVRFKHIDKNWLGHLMGRTSMARTKAKAVEEARTTKNTGRECSNFWGALYNGIGKNNFTSREFPPWRFKAYSDIYSI
jgi:hypothetical protein